ncbi:MAG: MFS transporter, partial [Firmicutes bacterium]|nr:MFS transporter [Bacillota bacterium]
PEKVVELKDRPEGVISTKTQQQIAPPVRRGVFYGWIIVLVCFVNLVVVFGSRYTFGLFMDPLNREFGWSRTSLSLAFSIFTILYGFLQPVTGAMMAKHRAKKILVLGALFMAVSTIGMGAVNSLWQVFILFGVLTAFGFSGLSLVPASVLVSRWFRRRKGSALAVMNTGVSVGQFLLAPVTMLLILTIGWRLSYVVLGALFLFPVIPLILLLVRDRPSEMGLLPDGDPVEGSQGSAAQGGPGAVTDKHVELRQAFRTSPFWLLSWGYFVCGFTVNIITVHLAVLALDRGFPAMTSASIMGVVGGMNVVGILLAGYLSDRLGRKLPLGFVYATRALAFILLLQGRSLASLYVFAVVYGLSQFATSPLVSALVGDLYGNRSMGTLLGFINASHQFGGAVGATLAGLAFDQLGTYMPILITSVVLLFSAAVISWLVPEKFRRLQAANRGPVPTASR